MARILVLSVFFLLAGCEAFEAFKALSGESGMHNELQVGDRENSGTLGDTSKIDSVKAYKGGTVNVDQSKPGFTGEAQTVNIIEGDRKTLFILILIAIVGWLAPSPGAIYNEIKGGLKLLFRK